MNDLIRSVMSFSRATSLFGANQMRSMLNPRSGLQEMSARLDAVARAMGSGSDPAQSSPDEELHHSDRPHPSGTTEGHAHDTVPDQLPADWPSMTPCGPIPSNPQEQVLILSTTNAVDLAIDPGFFDRDGRPYFKIQGNLCTNNGHVVGDFVACYGGQEATFHDFLAYPLPEQNPQEPIDQPPAHEWTPPLNWSKSQWNFNGKGSLQGVGMVLNRMARQPGGKTRMLWFGTSTFITGGTGIYRNTRGMATTSGSVDLTALPDPGVPNPNNMVHVLKILPPKNSPAYKK